LLIRYNLCILEYYTTLISKFNVVNSSVFEAKYKSLNRAFHRHYLALASFFCFSYGRQRDRVIPKFSAVPDIELHMKGRNQPLSCCTDFNFFYSMITGAIALYDVDVVVKTYRS